MGNIFRHTNVKMCIHAHVRTATESAQQQCSTQSETLCFLCIVETMQRAAACLHKREREREGDARTT